VTALLAHGSGTVEEPLGETVSFADVGFHPHLETIAVTVGFALLYWFAIRRLGPRLAPAGKPPVSVKQVALFGSGLAILFVGAYWPVHDISERYLFSVHMGQHTLFSLVAPPLLIMGTPPWLQRWLLSPPAVKAVARRVTRPVFAGLVFNAVVVITHVPGIVSAVTPNEVAHFTAHLVLFTASMCMWFPVVNVLPEMPGLSYPGKGLYLFLHSIIPTIPASFLTFAEKPLYAIYAEFPRLWGMGVVEDQQLAGAIMKVGGTTILWGCIIGIFFRWYAETEKNRGKDLLTWDEVAAAFESTPAPPDSLSRRG
jgi:putative membrane protein